MCTRISTIATAVTNVRKIVARSRIADSNFVDVIALGVCFHAVLQEEFFFSPRVPALALTQPIVALIETPGNCPVAVFVAVVSARFAPGGFHAWGGIN